MRKDCVKAVPKPYLGTDDRMNKTERDYADHLYGLQLAKEIISYEFEGVKLRLGKGAWYTPDFLVVTPERFELHEVKGFWREAARVRIKTAAAKHPYFKFIVIKYDKPSRRAIARWKFEEIN